MNKKGQVAVFIIVGILILLSAALFFALKEKVSTAEFVQKKETSFLVSDNANQILLYTEFCLKSTLNDAVQFTAAHGGYYALPEYYSIYSPLSVIPYYFSYGENESKNIPTKERIEKQIAKYVEDYIPFCLQNYAAFDKTGVTIEKEKPTAKVSIAEKKVYVHLTMPVTVAQDAYVQQLFEYETELRVDYAKIINAVNSYAAAQESASNKIPVTTLADIGENEEVTFDVYFAGDTVLYTIVENRTKIDGKPLSFWFAVNYDWAKEKTETTFSQHNFSIRVGEEVTYAIPENEAPLEEEEYVQENTFRFTATEEDVGYNRFVIATKDAQGNKKYTILDVDVNEG